MIHQCSDPLNCLHCERQRTQKANQEAREIARDVERDNGMADRESPSGTAIVNKQCEELIQPNGNQLGRYIADGTRQCKNNAKVKTKFGWRCTFHANRIANRIVV